MTEEPTTTTVRVQAVRWQGELVRSYELSPVKGGELPGFDAGAHIDVHLPNGLTRSYSLCNDPAERHRYVIGVARDANSRGGSSWIHDKLHVGQTLRVSHPRNNFPLDERAAQTVLIAGGIGITPLLSMARRLSACGRSWTLHYAVRGRAQAAFLPVLEALAGAECRRLLLHVDEEERCLLDLSAIVAGADPAAQIYCCGPAPMLAAFEKAAADRPGESVHVEYFAAKEPSAVEGGYEVELARSGVTLSVPPGMSILDTVLAAGLEAPYSCKEGVCGSCETAVRAGVPDHRDMVLSDRERESNEVMMICCSGSVGPRLVLDL